MADVRHVLTLIHADAARCCVVTVAEGRVLAVSHREHRGGDDVVVLRASGQPRMPWMRLMSKLIVPPARRNTAHRPTAAENISMRFS